MPLYDYMDFTSYNKTTEYENRSNINRAKREGSKFLIGKKRPPSNNEAEGFNESVMESIGLNTRRQDKNIISFSDGDEPIIGKRRNRN